ncbi:transglutaminase family protein [Brachybacterium sp. UMB0905]|uniref:transglutaminase-like domain-containing protein n=1 Tax=Brachybacterium sp. UMB0905 TaxID=2069310 RepID=UPI001E5DCAC6|nr:transglutaminase-like domain-containing protein [Brachybacterium sp. UMB0905]
MERHVRAWMRAEVAEGTDVALLVAVADTPVGKESLQVTTGDGQTITAQESRDRYGNRMHLLSALPEGSVEIVYAARDITAAGEPVVEDSDAVTYLRPSRYCEVDEFTRAAAEVVGTAQGTDAVDAVVQWVAEHLDYVPGSSTITDSARSTYLARQGVCRDYAHLTATLLRASGIPARCVAVYAPGLAPMDFHLVVEALVENRWLVVDATHLAPRESMVRIATGQDAADTAFMTTLNGDLQLTGIQVTAVVDPQLPREDHE